jgi:hypothetical protein
VRRASSRWARRFHFISATCSSPQAPRGELRGATLDDATASWNRSCSALVSDRLALLHAIAGSDRDLTRRTRTFGSELARTVRERARAAGRGARRCAASGLKRLEDVAATEDAAWRATVARIAIMVRRRGGEGEGGCVRV